MTTSGTWRVTSSVNIRLCSEFEEDFPLLCVQVETRFLVGLVRIKIECQGKVYFTCLYFQLISDESMHVLVKFASSQNSHKLVSQSFDLFHPNQLVETCGILGKY